MCVAIPALALACSTARWSYADWLAGSDELSRVQRAASLDPANPQIKEKLGLISLFTVSHPRLADAEMYFNEAIRLAPLRTDYRVDLASACDWRRDFNCSDAALQQVLKLSPMAPRLEWITANHYIRTGRAALAIMHFRRLLELDTDYARPTFALCTRLFADPQLILKQVIPAQQDPALKLLFMDFLCAQGRLSDAGVVWSQVAASGQKFTFERAEPYLEGLIGAGDIQQAKGVWHDALRLQVIRSPRGEKAGDLVFNGGFDQAPLNAGFDWRAVKVPFVETDFQDPSGAGAAPSLRIDFTVARNEEAEPVFQLVPVQPYTAYALSAQVRSRNITSDSGPRLRLVDPQCPVCLDVQTEGTTGTTPWHLLTLRFTTGKNTHVVRISVWRPRSRAYPTEISGSFWLDDVSIRQEQ